MNSLDDYIPRPGLSVPIVTILDARGRILEDQQRAVVRFALQNGAGADIIFAAGTTGEWDRIDNSRRQAVTRIAIEAIFFSSTAIREINSISTSDSQLKL